MNQHRGRVPPDASVAECKVVARHQLNEIPLYHAGRAPATTKRTRWKSVKLSSNERTASPPLFIRRAIKRAGRDIHRYPPRLPTSLAHRLANRFAVSQESITIGNGSDELMGLIGQAYLNADDEVIVFRHTFSIYAHVARVAGAQLKIADMPNNRMSVEHILKQISARTKVIFVATPNNPTGGYLTTSQMNVLCQQVSNHILIVIDHAYADFCVASDFCAAETLITRHTNVVTLRTFSKLDGLAGLRIGYAISHPSIAAQLNRIRMPFNVNRIALHVADVALMRHDYALRIRDRIVSEREAMRNYLLKLGYDVAETHSNFLFIRLHHDSGELEHLFTTQGITIRSLKSFGLPQCVRITIALSRRVNARVRLVMKQYSRMRSLGHAEPHDSFQKREGRDT